MEGAGYKKSWTDGEKAFVFFQIMAKVGSIPWEQLDLPEGRTIKACQMMIAKEKLKMKDFAKDGKTPNQSAQKKRDTANGHDDETPSKKSKVKGGKKQAAASVVYDDEEGDGLVKAEPKSEEEVDDLSAL